MKTESYREERLLRLIFWILLTGIATIYFYSISVSLSGQTPSFSKGLEVFSINMGIAGGALSVGGILGFLFGIPRSGLSGKAAPENSGEASNGESSRPRSNERYGDNDSLEQISDWLTKILLGAGLAQISSISGALSSLASQIDSVSTGNSLGIFGVSVFTIYIVCGFIGGYLWARFSVRTELTRRDQDLAEMVKANSNKIQGIGNAVEEVRAELKHDFEVLLRLHERIDPSTPLPTAQEEKRIIEDFKDLFCKASDRVRYDVFRQIQDIRADNWSKDKIQMAKTIPIFKAIIAAEKNSPVFKENLHRVFFELGCAIKDKQDVTASDYCEAKDYLDQAIHIRDEIGNCDIQARPWFAYYEFNYVFCLFGCLSDDELHQDTQQREIAQKLKVVYEAGFLKKICERDARKELQKIRVWMQKYKLDEKFELPPI